MKIALFFALVPLTVFASAKAFADCGYVTDPMTGDMIWSCDMPSSGSCGYIFDPATGDPIWVCN